MVIRLSVGALACLEATPKRGLQFTGGTIGVRRSKHTGDIAMTYFVCFEQVVVGVYDCDRIYD